MVQEGEHMSKVKRGKEMLGTSVCDQWMLKMRSLVSLLLILVVAAYSAWLLTNSSSLQICTEHQTATKSQQAKENAPPIALSLTDKIAIYSRCAGHVLYEYREATTAVATIFIALFTLTLWLSTSGLLKATRETIDLARAEFISTHRPRLRIRSVARSTTNPADFIGISFAVVNVGDSDANLLGSQVMVDFFPEKPPIDSGGTDVVQPRKFLPGASDSYVATSHHRKWLILQSEYNASRYLFVYGQIVYRNDLGTTYTTSFCRIWNLASNRFKRTDDPDYEYED
jgi:hypothetical protein